LTLIYFTDFAFQIQEKSFLERVGTPREDGFVQSELLTVMLECYYGTLRGVYHKKAGSRVKIL